jgi:hypothetical protein
MTTTVREARIAAASRALDEILISFGDGLSTGHLRIAAEAVVDALFTDPSIAPRVGSIWEWEPLKDYARQTVRMERRRVLVEPAPGDDWS